MRGLRNGGLANGPPRASLAVEAMESLGRRFEAAATEWLRGVGRLVACAARVARAAGVGVRTA